MIDEYLIEQKFMNLLDNENSSQAEFNKDELSEFFERYTFQRRQLREVFNTRRSKVTPKIDVGQTFRSIHSESMFPMK